MIELRFISYWLLHRKPLTFASWVSDFFIVSLWLLHRKSLVSVSEVTGFAMTHDTYDSEFWRFALARAGRKNQAESSCLPACEAKSWKTSVIVSPCHREQSRRCLVSLFGFGHKFPCLRLRWLSEVEIHKLLFLSWRLQSGNLLQR